MVTPLWLLGLALLPLIRWLHRGGRHRRAVPVSHLGLWRGAAASPAGMGERRPPDPAWRRRALLYVLLLLALAQPQWPQRQPPVTLWVDDSLSMLTREPEVSRLAAGLAQARSALAEAALSDFELRPLSEPWRNLGSLTDAHAASLVASAGRQLPRPPPAALLRGDRLHWLLTDGAHAALLDWPAGQQPDRVIQVATVQRNVGLERLSARRNAHDPDRIDLLLRLSNGGASPETRVLVWSTESGETSRSTHALAPGTSVHVPASVRASARVRAALQPGDALAEDDQIELELAPLHRRRVAIDAACPPALLAAVATHPALVPVAADAAEAMAALDCGSRERAPDRPTIRVRAEHLAKPLGGPLRWSSTLTESGRLRLDGEGLRRVAQLPARPGDVVLLAAADESLIIQRAGSTRLLETSLDLGAAGMPAGAGVPLLVNLMFEQLLEAPLLDELAISDRGPAASQVVPVPRARAAPAAQVEGGLRHVHDGARPLLLLALLVLLWELVALARQWRRLGAPAGAGAA